VMGTERTISDLFMYITAHIPQISYGYSPELERLFKRDPQALKTQPVLTHGIKVTVVQDDNPSNGW